MKRYIVLLRGVNVGGKARIPMAELRDCLEELGFVDVSTYIASGNVLLSSDKNPHDIRSILEQTLIHRFNLGDLAFKALVLTPEQLQVIVDNKPTSFGEQPGVYHSDAIFLIDGTVADAMPAFDPREGVDSVWPGKGVIYSQRLSAERTKSRLGKIIASPVYKSMTIRSWTTVTKLLELSKSTQK